MLEDSPINYKNYIFYAQQNLELCS